MVRKKIFIGGVNTDDADFVVDAKQFIGGLNIRFASSRLGDFGKPQTIEGAREITLTTDYYGNPTAFSLPAGDNETIGAIEDPVTQRVFFMNRNSNGDNAIYVYDILSGYIYMVLHNMDIEGGLDFDSDVHSMDVYGNMLYWCNSDSWQKRINYEAGIKAYHPAYAGTEVAYDISSPMPASIITLIRYQPVLPPTGVKDNDDDYENNFISDVAVKFQYRFIYRDGEESTLSALSELFNYSTTDEDDLSNKKIIVKIPFAEVIKQDVQRVELVVKYLPLGNAFVIKRWDKRNDDDVVEIEDHNSNTTQLTYSFFNDIIGTALADTYYEKQFDAVPRTSETLQIGKNKLFLGNNLDGYDTPTKTSLSLAPVVVGDDFTGRWYHLVHYIDGTHTTTAEKWFIDITNIGVSGGFYNYNTSSVPPYPASVDFATEVTLAGYGITDVMTGLGLTTAEVVSFVYDNATSIVTNPPAIDSNIGVQVFKSDATIKAGMVFYDQAMRKCGVVTNDGIKITTIDRTFNNPAFTTGVDWTLSNADAITEIPDWAYWYAPVLQKCLRTRFFIQIRSTFPVYVKYDADGAYVTEDTYDEDVVGLGVNLTHLLSDGLGYSFQGGDLVKVYESTGEIHKLKTKGTFGQYLICDPIDLGTLDIDSDIFVEIYSPYFPSVSEPYYEVAQIFPVSNPGEYTRAYSIIEGTFKGDVTVIERSIPGEDYQVEAMSSNDNFWQNWNTHHGRSNVITQFGESRKRLDIAWSSQAIPGTKVMGLSTFDGLDLITLPSELVALRKLALVDKIESEGSVMLAIGEKETSSLYLGETQVIDNGGASFLAATTGTIGTVNTLKGSYGTINPESVSVRSGSVYWFDAIEGCAVSYSGNGLFAISDYKMYKFFKTLGKLVRESGLKVYGGFDAFHDEALFFMPRTTYIPQNTILEDVELNSYTYEIVDDAVDMEDIKEGRVYKLTLPPYATATYNGELISGNVFVADDSKELTISPVDTDGSVVVTEIMRSCYEPFDGQGGIEVFNPTNDMWVGKRSFRPQWMSGAGNALVSFNNGKLYVHDDTGNYNTFYGVVYDSIIAGLHNEDGNSIKLYRAVSVEGDLFDIMHFRTEKPNEQSTDLYANEFKNAEGLKRSSLKRDRLSPNKDGTYDEKLFTGDEMRGEVLKFQGVFLSPTTLKSFKFVNIKFDPSLSHTE